LLVGGQRFRGSDTIEVSAAGAADGPREGFNPPPMTS
jgi:hypothetical protein